MSELRQEVLQVATRLFEQSPDWVTFFREILGLDGVVRAAFASADRLAEFEAGPEFKQIQQMLAKLREKTLDSVAAGKEPQRVITVRLPRSMHEALKGEAQQRHTSMNKLCISKLLQSVATELVPAEYVQPVG